MALLWRVSEAEYLEAFELHSPKKIRAALAAGASPVNLIKGKKPIEILIEMYTRSPQFAECLRVMLDDGVIIASPLWNCWLMREPTWRCG